MTDHPQTVRETRGEIDGPLFVHDFTGAVLPPHEARVDDVTLSCDHPATITVAYMGRGLTATLDEARANARRLAACWNYCRGMPTEELEAHSR